LKSMTLTKTETDELSKAFNIQLETPAPPPPKPAPAPPPPAPAPVDKDFEYEKNMDPEIQKQIDAEIKAGIEKFVKDQETKEAAVKARIREVEEIHKIGEKFGRPGEAAKFIEEGKSAAEFNSFILDRLNAHGMKALSLIPEPDTKTVKRRDFDSMTV